MTTLVGSATATTTNVNTPSPNFVFGGVFTATSTGTATTFNFYAAGNGTGTQKITPVIYATSSGAPTGAPLAVGAETTVSGAAGWYSSTISQSITSGTAYALMLMSGPTTGSGSIIYAANSGTGYYEDNTYSSAPNPYGTGSTETNGWDFYLADSSGGSTTLVGSAATTTTNVNTPLPDFVFGGVFTASTTATAQSFNFYASGVSGGSQKFTPVIYGVSAGAPTGSPLATGAEVNVSGATAWFSSAISVNITSGTSYALMLMSGPSTGSGSAIYAANAGTGYYQDNSYSTAPDPYGTGSTETNGWDFYLATTAVNPTTGGSTGSLTGSGRRYAADVDSQGWRLLAGGARRLASGIAPVWLDGNRKYLPASGASFSSGGPLVRGQSPVGYWPLDEVVTLGGSAYDRSGNGLYGTYPASGATPVRCALTGKEYVQLDHYAGTITGTVGTTTVGTSYGTAIGSGTTTTLVGSTTATTTNANNPSANFLFGTVFTATSTGTASAFHFYGAGNSGGTQKFTPVVYAATAGVPTGTALGTGAEVTVSGAAQWWNSALSASVTSGSQYFLGLMSGTVTGSGALVYADNSGTGRFQAITYPTPPNPYGSDSTEVNGWDFYLDATTGVSGALLVGNVYTAAASGTTVDVQVYCQGGAAQSSFYPVIYNATGTSTVTTLLGVGNKYTIPTGVSPAFVSARIGGLTITSGSKYWVGIQADGTASGGTFAYAASGTEVYAAAGTFGSPASTFPTASTQTRTFSMFAELEADGASISIPHNSSFNLGTASAARWTLHGVWNLTDSAVPNPTLASKGTAAGTYWMVTASAASRSVSVTFNGTAFTSSTNVLPAVGTDFHLVVTWDGTQLRVYVNGVKVYNTVGAVTALTVSDTGPMLLGGGPSLSLNGRVGDVAVLPAQVVDAQVLALYLDLPNGATASGASGGGTSGGGTGGTSGGGTSGGSTPPPAPPPAPGNGRLLGGTQNYNNYTAYPQVASVSAPAPMAIPSGGINVAAGANLATVISSNPGGSQFNLAAGTYTGSNVQITPPSGTSIYGQGAGKTILSGYRFTGGSANCTFANFTIRDCTWLGSGSWVGGSFQSSGDIGLAAIDSDNHGDSGQGWRIFRVESAYNNQGLACGSGSIVDNCFLHHNVHIGFGMGGAQSLYQYITSIYNNLGNTPDGGNKAGLMGVGANTAAYPQYNTSGKRTIVQYCYLADNGLSGNWSDVYAQGVLWQYNISVRNGMNGIMDEINAGNSVIQNNIVAGNGSNWGDWQADGILVSTSYNDLVQNNYAWGNRASDIQLYYQGRGNPYGNNTVINNVVGVAIGHTYDIGTSVGGSRGADNISNNTIMTSSTAIPQIACGLQY